jgi:magnesium transporter
MSRARRSGAWCFARWASGPRSGPSTLIAVVAPFVGAEVSDPVALGAVLTLGMMGSMTIAAMVGASIPLLMHRLKIDPAVSTGPFVTTAVDILGLMFYFWLATVLLGVSM